MPPLIDFSEDVPTATGTSLTGKKTTRLEKTNYMDNVSQTATLNSSNVSISLVASKSSAYKQQEHRESKNRSLDFAYGGARASDRARVSPPKKEAHLLDTLGQGMEASKALPVNMSAQKGQEPEEQTASKPESLEPVFTRHLLD
jgi:hypothetical protein